VGWLDGGVGLWGKLRYLRAIGAGGTSTAGPHSWEMIEIQGLIKLVFFAFRLRFCVRWEGGSKSRCVLHDCVVADVGKLRVRAGFVGGHI